MYLTWTLLGCKVSNISALYHKSSSWYIAAQITPGFAKHKKRGMAKTQKVLYSRLLLWGPNIFEICKHNLDLQNFLLIANVFIEYFLPVS